MPSEPSQRRDAYATIAESRRIVVPPGGEDDFPLAARHLARHTSLPPIHLVARRPRAAFETFGRVGMRAHMNVRPLPRRMQERGRRTETRRPFWMVALG